MDALLAPHTASYAGSRTSTLANAVYLRLATPPGSWWADPSLGSRLHELRRAKDLSRKLAEGHVLVLSIKCPRCRAHNHLKAAEPPASASSHATAKEAHAWPTTHHR